MTPDYSGCESYPVALGSGVHAVFTTAQAGNLGLNTDDDAARVAANRRRLAETLGVPVAFASQVHGAEVLRLDSGAAAAWGAASSPASAGEADAMVTTVPGLGLGVLVADCVPVLLADPIARVVGVAHAGRAGVVKSVVPRTVEAMVAAGATRANLRAAIGPAICGRCYEVPALMRDQVAAEVPAAFATTSWGTPALDLPTAVRSQLAEAGVGVVGGSAPCTLEDETFYSHRRAVATGAKAGRLAGVVVLEG